MRATAARVCVLVVFIVFVFLSLFVVLLGTCFCFADGFDVDYALKDGWTALMHVSYTLNIKVHLFASSLFV